MLLAAMPFTPPPNIRRTWQRDSYNVSRRIRGKLTQEWT